MTRPRTCDDAAEPEVRHEVSCSRSPSGVARRSQRAEDPAVAAAALKERFAGKVYAATLADGTRWRLDYKSNGYFFVDTSTGFRGTGDWRADDGKLCARLRGGSVVQRSARGRRGDLPEARQRRGDRLTPQ